MDIVYKVVDVLERLSIPYMLVGSFSSNFYGIARSTKDADFVVELGEYSTAQIADHLGPDFHFDPQMSFETITGTYRFIATHSQSAFKIEFFLLSNDAHDRMRFTRRKREPLPGRDTYVAAAEDVIVTKLRWSKGGNRKKDIDDVRNVIRYQASQVDWAYVERWCDLHGTRDLLDMTRLEAGSEGPRE